MRNFDLYFSKRWSSLFPHTCLTERRLSEPYSSNRSQDFLHRVSPSLFASFENVVTPSPARHNPSEIQFPQWPLHFCRRFLFCFGNGRSFSAFCLVVRQPYDAGTNTYPLLYIPFLFFVKLTFRRMTIFTRRSRASTFQIVSARLSKNDTRITFALDTSFLRHTSTSCR